MVTQTELINEINTNLPTNNARAITAAILRGVLTDMVGASFQQTSVISAADYGAFGDGTEHPITQADINANTQWAGVYDVGTSWDTVAIQEAILAAFTNALPAPANAIKVTATSDTLADGFWGNRALVVNGFIGGGLEFLTSGNVAGLYIQFSFKEGPVVITEATMYQTTNDNQGTWQWQGSNDGTTWVNIGGNFTLGGNTTQIQTTLNGNVTAYSRYQLLGIAGVSVAGPIIQEFQFLQNGSYVTGNRSFNYSWNSIVPRRLYVPPGYYWINRTLLLVAQNFNIEFAERGSSQLQWHGEQHSVALKTDSIAYGTIRNLSFLSNNPIDILWDMNGDGFYGGLKTQQVTVYDLVLNGFNAKTGVAISRAGGSAQGDTILFVNPYISNCINSGVSILSQNALSIIFLGGDFQGNWRDSISIGGGNAFIFGTSFQGQAAALSTSPPRNQILLYGADVRQYSGAGGTVKTTLRDIRSESDVLHYNLVKNGKVDSCATAAAGHNNWFASYPYLKGHLLLPTTNNTKGRTFIPVDLNGPTGNYPYGWYPMDATSSTTTKIVDPSATYLVNQWVGYRLHFRFSNGFAEHHVISSNTATEIFIVGDPLSDAPNPFCLYNIGGITGAVAPNFDSATGGSWYQSGDAFQGFTTTANSDQLGTTSATPVAVGQYVIIPGADSFGNITGREVETALIAKIIANLGVGLYQMDRKAGKSVTFSAGYWGSGLADNQITYIEVPYAALAGATEVENCSFAAGTLMDVGTVIRTEVTRTEWLGGSNPAPDPLSFAVQQSKQFTVLDTASIGTSGVIDMTTALNSGDIFVFTPTNDVTLNAPTLSYPTLSRRISIHVVTAGIVSFNVTFGTNFKSTGVLATGGVTDKAFVVVFESCQHGGSIYWHEVSRSGPL